MDRLHGPVTWTGNRVEKNGHLEQIVQRAGRLGEKFPAGLRRTDLLVWCLTVGGASVHLTCTADRKRPCRVFPNPCSATASTEQNTLQRSTNDLLVDLWLLHQDRMGCCSTGGILSAQPCHWGHGITPTEALTLPLVADRLRVQSQLNGM